MNHVAVVLLATTLVLGACSSEPERPRKVQMVKLLPDTPPPPPPPPKPEDRPPPKANDAPKPADMPKPEAPVQQALKSDEAAGDGPGNGLAAGAVTRDYSDQALGQAQVIGGGAPAESGAQRLAANAFANATTRTLNEFLARDRDVKRLDYQVRVDLWLSPAGGLQRVLLVGSSGDDQTDQALRLALERFPGASSPLPQRLQQPLRLLVTNRMMG